LFFCVKISDKLFRYYDKYHIKNLAKP